MLTSHHYGEIEWLDIVDPTDEDLESAAQRFQLHRYSFDEANRRAARPTLLHYPDHVYMVAFSGKLAEIDMYLGVTWLITVRRHDPNGNEWDPSTAIGRFERRHGHDPSAGFLLMTILDELVDGYFDATDVIEDEIEVLEDRIFAEEEKTTLTIQQELLAIRRRLLELRRVVMPLREVLAQMARQEVAGIDGAEIVLCRDTFDKLLRAVDVVDEQRELLGNAADAHLSVMSNQMNVVMKKLTAWGSIAFVATLLAGIYGMNFTHMPELHWYWGYPMALGTMLVLSALLYRMFRRRDWL